MSVRKNGSNAEVVEQQVAEHNRKLNECADRVLKLQAEIDTEDAISIKHGKRTLELVIEAGTILIAAQELIKKSDVQWRKKGLWGKWVAENVKGITFRTVQNYLRLSFEARRRDEKIKYFHNKGMEVKTVRLLDETNSLREAYRAVGIIKRKAGSNKDGECDPKKSTVDQFKRKHRVEYDERCKQERSKIQKTVKDIIDDEKFAKWNLIEWTIEDGKPIPPDKGTRSLMTGLLHYIEDHEKKLGLTREDEVFIKAGSVFAELFIRLIRSNQKETAITPETNREDRLKDENIARLLKTINPFPLEPVKAATPPVQTVHE